MAKRIVFETGQRIGKWELQGRLGCGGQAEVWKVRHETERHTIPAAIKLLVTVNSQGIARFKREIELLKKHKHENIVSLLDHGNRTEDGAPYYVMERANASLDRLSANDTAGVRLLHESPILLLNFFRQACAAIEHLHANGVVHRDIKPSNILLMLDGPDPMRAAVCDLGIAAPQDDQRNLTSTHEAVGTPIYRAPEATFGKHTIASDIYALGKTLEFIFTRVTPATYGPRSCPRDSRLSAGAWDAIDAVQARACAYNPKDRYPGVRELIDALPALTIGCVPDSVAEHRRAPTLTLSRAEIQLLAAIIGRCPAPQYAAPVHGVLNDTRLEKYESSISLRQLEAIGFVEFSQASDRNDEEFPTVKPTAAGFQWAMDNREDVDAAARAASGDDIPF